MTEQTAPELQPVGPPSREALLIMAAGVVTAPPGVLIVAGSDGQLSKMRKLADDVLKTMSLANPHGSPSLREKDGLHPEVQAWLFTQKWGKGLTVGQWADDQADAYIQTVEGLHAKGDYDTYGIVVVCFGGRHRSVAVADRVGRRIAVARPQWSVEVRRAPLQPLPHKPIPLTETELVFRSQPLTVDQRAALGV